MNYLPNNRVIFDMQANTWRLLRPPPEEQAWTEGYMRRLLTLAERHYMLYPTEMSDAELELVQHINRVTDPDNLRLEVTRLPNPAPNWSRMCRGVAVEGVVIEPILGGDLGDRLRQGERGPRPNVFTEVQDEISPDDVKLTGNTVTVDDLDELFEKIDNITKEKP